MKNDSFLPNIRVPTADLAMYRRQAEASGLSLAAWVRRALDRAAAVPASVTTSEPQRSVDHRDPIDAKPASQAAADRIAALASLPGLRRGSELAVPPPEHAPPTPERRPSAGERQQIITSAAHAYRAGTEPAVIIMRLAAGFPHLETYIRATVERMDGAA